MPREYAVVDAFAAEPFTGNPAAVVFNAEGLDDSSMLAIAAEFNLSETTFILPAQTTRDSQNQEPKHASNSRFHFRWFTPTTEVYMCVHATIAGIHALHETGKINDCDASGGASLQIETRSGTLDAFVELMPGETGKNVIWLELPPPTISCQDIDIKPLATSLNIAIDSFDSSLKPAATQDRDLIVFVQDVAALNSINPDFSALTAWLDHSNLRGLSVATTNTLSPTIHVQSRFFAPTVGINEDPVTGSVHGPLGLYLAQQGVVEVNDGQAGLQCVQCKAGGRAGLVWVLIHNADGHNPSVRIGGQAITTMRGVIAV